MPAPIEICTEMQNGVKWVFADWGSELEFCLRVCQVKS